MRAFRSRSTRRTVEIETRIEEAIESLRPMLRIEACAVRLERFDVEEGVAYVEISGDCPDCDMKAATFVEGIEAHLRRQIPEIVGVRTTTCTR